MINDSSSATSTRSTRLGRKAAVFAACAGALVCGSITAAVALASPASAVQCGAQYNFFTNSNSNSNYVQHKHTRNGVASYYSTAYVWSKNWYSSSANTWSASPSGYYNCA
jgi:hypothetical protein